MSPRTGYVSGRPGTRPDDPDRLVAERLDALRRLPYAELRRMAHQPPQVEEAAEAGQRLRRRTTVTREGGALRIRVEVDEGTFGGRSDPLAAGEITVTPG